MVGDSLVGGQIGFVGQWRESPESGEGLSEAGRGQRGLVGGRLSSGGGPESAVLVGRRRKMVKRSPAKLKVFRSDIWSRTRVRRRSGLVR